MELNLAGRSLEGIWGAADGRRRSAGGRASECLGWLDRRLGELMLKEFGVEQWKFIHHGSSVDTVEIRLLEKSGEIPSAVESRRILRRVNPVKNFG